MKTLNKNIDKYNLMVPMLNAQMFQFNVIREAKATFKAVMKNLEGITDPKEIEEKLQVKTEQPSNQPAANSFKTSEFGGNLNHKFQQDEPSVWSYLKNEFMTYFKGNNKFENR